jgi:hypothetical protein
MRIPILNSYSKVRLSMVAGLALVLVGVAGIAPSLYFRWTNQGSVASHGTPAPISNALAKPQVRVISGQPIAIAIPSLSMNLSVINGYYDSHSGTWTLTLDKAQFATPSVLPNNVSGNTLIYGHYRPEVFAYLHLIKPGSQAIITTANGYQFTYQYYGSYATQPTDTSVFAYRGPAMLTIQTCSGSFFQNRQMYQFALLGYQKV